ncbi:MAG: twin-arginine translocation signal domain-containing protein, partial [Salinigranum sp.]
MTNETEIRSDEPGDEGTERSLTRRGFLGGALAGGAAAVVPAGSGVDIRLGGHIPGWKGMAPSAIQGKENPTLTLTAGKKYTLVWKNLDGAPHNFTIEDAGGNVMVRTSIVSTEGNTQKVTFTAKQSMA